MIAFYIGAALAALAVVLLVMPKFLPYLKKLKFGQTIYELGPQSHLSKQGTPNMGGVVIALGTVGAMLAGGIAMCAVEGLPLGSGSLLWPMLFVMLGSMAIGFADDYIKDVRKNHEGLKPMQKIAGQVVVGLAFSVWSYFLVGSEIILPFTDKTWNLGIFYIPLMTVLVIFMTNSANLQDGIDGILSSVTVIGMGLFGLLAALMAQGNQTVALVCFALCGGCLGFLRFNHYPAKIFMGDTGSMFIGGAMVGTAMLTRSAFLLLLFCFTCVASSVSVMMQTTYFKYTKKRYGTGKRIFKMTPIHHSFEKDGMSENQIVAMYAAVTLFLSLVALLSMLAWF